MESGCPSKCFIAAQRPLHFLEYSLLPSKARAELVLLNAQPKLCEACGAVYGEPPNRDSFPLSNFGSRTSTSMTASPVF